MALNTKAWGRRLGRPKYKNTKLRRGKHNASLTMRIYSCGPGSCTCHLVRCIHQVTWRPVTPSTPKLRKSLGNNLGKSPLGRLGRLRFVTQALLRPLLYPSAPSAALISSFSLSVILVELCIEGQVELSILYHSNPF